jgi:hypothetical protein
MRGIKLRKTHDGEPKAQRSRSACCVVRYVGSYLCLGPSQCLDGSLECAIALKDYELIGIYRTLVNSREKASSSETWTRLSTSKPALSIDAHLNVDQEQQVRHLEVQAGRQKWGGILAPGIFCILKYLAASVIRYNQLQSDRVPVCKFSSNGIAGLHFARLKRA